MDYISLTVPASWLLGLALAAVSPARAAPPEVERELAAVVDKFYGMDFEGARAGADAIEKRLPGHPAGPFYRGVASFQLWVAGGMSSTAAYASFESDHSAAEAAAKALMKTAPAEAHYYLGAVLGFRSRANAAQKRFLRALPDGAAAVKHLKKALAMDPSLDDARLGLGMYHYFAARMPAGARPFAYLLIGEGGDRAKGLEELRAVAQSTCVARMEARSVLSTIYSKEDESSLAEADALLAELTARYPRNPLYRLRRAFVAERMGDLERAMSLADPDGGWIATIHPLLRGSARAWALYRAAEVRLLQGRAAETGRWLDELDGLLHPRGLKDWVLLRQGNRLDAEGRRDEASAMYRRIKDKRPAALAERFLVERYPAGPKDAAPFFTGY